MKIYPDEEEFVEKFRSCVRRLDSFILLYHSISSGQDHAKTMEPSIPHSSCLRRAVSSLYANQLVHVH